MVIGTVGIGAVTVGLGAVVVLVVSGDRVTAAVPLEPVTGADVGAGAGAGPVVDGVGELLVGPVVTDRPAALHPASVTVVARTRARIARRTVT
jgi:hypothetical protein